MPNQAVGLAVQKSATSASLMKHGGRTFIGAFSAISKSPQTNSRATDVEMAVVRRRMKVV